MTKPVCVVHGCEKPMRQHKVCMMHLYRMRRRGTYDPSPPRAHQTPVIDRTTGYVRVHAPEHPIGRTGSATWQHRIVLFDKIGYGPHRCHWCGKHINWRSGLEADHVDSVRHNNAPDNLVESCHGCNTRRARKRSRNGHDLPTRDDAA